MEKNIVVKKRKFGIYEYGIESGPVVFYFHGFPGSRLDGFLFDFDTVASNLGLRIIAIDRPGIGNSEFKINRKLQDWVFDVSNIADHLKIDKFSVLAISGGAPYALAIASGLPDRLHSVSIVSGMGPFQYKESLSGSAMQIPKLNSLLRRIIVWFMKLGIKQNPEKFKNRICSTLPVSDNQWV
jgi:pimeloyl-ACP methyl ester carboxylesterase